MKLKRIFAVLTSCLLTLSLAACGNNQTVSSNKIGNEEEVVVATSVAVTEILDALEVDVAGVPNTSYELPESTKDAVRVGNPMSPNLEIIKSLNPDVVVSVDTLGSDYEKLFTDNKIPSEFVSLSSLESLKETIDSLGRKFNKMDKAQELVNDISNKEAELSKNKLEKEKIELLVLFAAPGSTMIATEKSYIGSLVEIAGGKNIIEDNSSAFVTYSNEEITKLNPEKILVMTHAMPEQTKAALEKEFEQSSAWQSLTAVKEGKVIYLDNTYFGMSANLKVIDGLGILQDIIYQ